MFETWTCTSQKTLQLSNQYGCVLCAAASRCTWMNIGLALAAGSFVKCGKKAVVVLLWATVVPAVLATVPFQLVLHYKLPQTSCIAQKVVGCGWTTHDLGPILFSLPRAELVRKHLWDIFALSASRENFMKKNNGIRTHRLLFENVRKPRETTRPWSHDIPESYPPYDRWRRAIQKILLSPASGT